MVETATGVASELTAAAKASALSVLVSVVTVSDSVETNAAVASSGPTAITSLSNLVAADVLTVVNATREESSAVINKLDQVRAILLRMQHALPLRIRSELSTSD